MFKVKSCALVLVVHLTGFSTLAYADKELSKGDLRWINEEVAALITTHEISVFKDIDSKDRKLFRKLFWARRDTNLSTDKSEFEEQFKRQSKIADKQYKQGKVKGYATDMGKIFLLLGAPTETSQGSSGEVMWTYAPDPQLSLPDGITFTFQKSAMVTSDELAETLNRVKTRFISNPTVVFSTNAEGRLLEPAGKPDPNSPANQILLALRESQTPSSDIPFETMIAFFRAGEGSIYIPILFKMDGAPLTWEMDSASATVFGVAENTDGHPIYQFEKPANLTRAVDGHTAFEMPIQLQPGRYNLYLGVRDNTTTTAGTQIVPLEVPDFSSGKLVLSSVLVYNEGREVSDPPGTPGHAFQFGPVKFSPTRRFQKTESLGLMFFVYGFGVDSASGQPNITRQYTLFKDGQRRGQTAEDPLQADAEMDQGVDYWELELSRYDPGAYKIQIKITDHVLDEVLTKEIEFVLEGESTGQ